MAVAGIDAESGDTLRRQMGSRDGASKKDLEGFVLAGLRRRGRMRERVEVYSQQRALESAERSDVALVVADATEGITEADLAACDQAAQNHCATLLVLNK